MSSCITRISFFRSSLAGTSLSYINSMKSSVGYCKNHAYPFSVLTVIPWPRGPGFLNCLLGLLRFLFIWDKISSQNFETATAKLSCNAMDHFLRSTERVWGITNILLHHYRPISLGLVGKWRIYDATSDFSKVTTRNKMYSWLQYFSHEIHVYITCSY